MVIEYNPVNGVPVGEIMTYDGPVVAFKIQPAVSERAPETELYVLKCVSDGSWVCVPHSNDVIDFMYLFPEIFTLVIWTGSAEMHDALVKAYWPSFAARFLW